MFRCGRSGTTIRATRGMAPMLLPARRGVKQKQGEGAWGHGRMGAWDSLVIVLLLVLVIEEAVSYQRSAIGQSLCLMLLLVLVLKT
jgi:hypothetical protein